MHFIDECVNRGKVVMCQFLAVFLFFYRLSLYSSCVVYGCMTCMCCFAGMLRPRGPCGLEAKSFGLSLGLTISDLGLDLGLLASGLGLIEIGLVASNIYSAHDIN